MVYLTIHSQASLTRWFTDRKYSCKSLHSNELQYNVFYNIALHYAILLYFTTTMYLCSLNIIAQRWTELHLTKKRKNCFQNSLTNSLPFYTNIQMKICLVYWSVFFTHRLQILRVGNMYIIDHFVIPALILAKVYFSKL